MVYISPAFLMPPATNATPADIIPNAKNKGVRPTIVEAAPVTLPVLAAVTWSATVGSRLTPTIMTMNPPNRFPNTFYHLLNKARKLIIYKRAVYSSALIIIFSFSITAS